MIVYLKNGIPATNVAPNPANDDPNTEPINQTEKLVMKKNIIEPTNEATIMVCLRSRPRNRKPIHVIKIKLR